MMTDNNANIRRKAFGIMKSIEIMNEKERLLHPSSAYGKNYNKLRNLCETNNSNLVQYLPPIVEFTEYDETEHRFAEIHSFCSEIYHLLEEA